MVFPEKVILGKEKKRRGMELGGAGVSMVKVWETLG